jgi:hypothetical protein
VKDVAGGMEVTPGTVICRTDTPFTALIDMVGFLWMALRPMRVESKKKILTDR